MRGGRGAALLQSRQRVKGRGLNVEGDMVVDSNNPFGEGDRVDCKITQTRELEQTREQNTHGSWRV